MMKMMEEMELTKKIPQRIVTKNHLLKKSQLVKKRVVKMMSQL
jgi:hypothetical protein